MANPSKSGYVTGAMWERILIIVFGAALMIIGASHFDEPYGGVVNYLRNKGAQLFTGGELAENPYGFSYVRARLRNSDRDHSLFGESRFSDSDFPDYEVENSDEFGFKSKIRGGRVLPMPQDVRRAVKSGNVSKLPKRDDVGDRNRKELDQLLNEF